MANTKNLSKDQRIRKEILRLKKIFTCLDANKKMAVEKLIDQSAFMAVTLEDLQTVTVGRSVGSVIW